MQTIFNRHKSNAQPFTLLLALLLLPPSSSYILLSGSVHHYLSLEQTFQVETTTEHALVFQLNALSNVLPLQLANDNIWLVVLITLMCMAALSLFGLYGRRFWLLLMQLIRLCRSPRRQDSPNVVTSIQVR